MSIWELEALAEAAVCLVADSDLDHRTRRSLYASIFETVNEFDVSFTHFRTVEELQASHFLMRIDVEDHPEYAARKEELDELISDGLEAWVSDDDDEIEALYVHDSNEGVDTGLWFDVTMALWPKLCAASKLEGLAAEPVTVHDPFETVVELMKLASQADEPRILKMLHGFMPWLIEGDVPDPDDDLFVEALAVPGLAEALAIDEDDWIDERFDARDHWEYADEEVVPFFEAWCAPYEEDVE